jgi:type IV secretory pathway ATPase VirB11/archaellum biosynthesis ATPase
MPSEFSDIGSISDGMLADYEMLSALMNNQTYLKNTQVPVFVGRNPSGDPLNSLDRKIMFKSSLFSFEFAEASKEVFQQFISVDRPLVFATVHGGGGKVTVSVKSAQTNGATFLLTKNGTGKVKGYITWLAITTA